MTWFGMKDMLREMGQRQQEIERQSNAEKVRQAELAAQIMQAKAEFTKDWETGVLNLENLSWALAMDEVDLANTAFNELVVQKRLSHAIPIIMAAIATKEDFQVRSAQSKRWLPPSMISEGMPLSDLEVSRDDFVKWTELMGYTLPQILNGFPLASEISSDMISPLFSGASTSEQDLKILEIITKKLKLNPMQLPKNVPGSPGVPAQIRPIAYELGFTKSTMKHTWTRLLDKNCRKVAYAK